MQVHVVGMHRHFGIFELDDQFHALVLGAGGEVQQRVFIEAELGEDAVEAGGGGVLRDSEFEKHGRWGARLQEDRVCLLSGTIYTHSPPPSALSPSPLTR